MVAERETAKGKKPTVLTFSVWVPVLLASSFP